MSNWSAALAAQDLDLLARIIRLVTDHEQCYGRTMTAQELKAQLDAA